MQLFGCIITMDAIFKALADPTRRILLDRLFQEQGQTLGQLIDGLDMRRQSATKHCRSPRSAVAGSTNFPANVPRPSSISETH
jgi:hypothetical protein